MSTRATYQIDNETFYIHHDGYPQGAAEYFAAALELKHKLPNLSFKEAFQYANERAEPTPRHDSHGDTEYQYTVDTRCDLLLKARGTRTRFSFNGMVEEFVNQYAKDQNHD